MHAVYTGNPKLGDAKKVMEQLVEVRRSIDLLNVEMSRLKVSFYIYLLFFLVLLLRRLSHLSLFCQLNLVYHFTLFPILYLRIPIHPCLLGSYLKLKELFTHAQSECGVPLGGGHSSLSNSCGASSSTSQSSSPRSSNVSRITVGNGNGCTNIHPASLAHRASSISTHSDSSTSAVSVNDALSSSANKSQQQSNNGKETLIKLSLKSFLFFMKVNNEWN